MGKQARLRRERPRSERVKRPSPVTFPEWETKVFEHLEHLFKQIAPGKDLPPVLFLETARGEHRHFAFEGSHFNTVEQRDVESWRTVAPLLRSHRARKAAFALSSWMAINEPKPGESVDALKKRVMESPSPRNREDRIDVVSVVVCNRDRQLLRIGEIERPEATHPRVSRWRDDLASGPGLEIWTRFTQPIQDSLIGDIILPLSARNKEPAAG